MTRPAATHPLLVPALAAAQFAPPFMVSGVAVALPALGHDLAAGATALSLVETLFLAASVAFLLPAGRLGDAAGKAAVFKGGLLAFAVATLAAGFATSTTALLALRFVQGAASAAVQASGPAIVADAVPPERRGKAFGIVIGSIYAGLTLGPICAGYLIEWWGWRAVFLVGGAVVFLLLIPAHVLLRGAWTRPAPGAVHVPGTLLLVAAMLALVTGAAMLREGAAGWGAAALGVALLVAFVLSQRGAEPPLVNVGLLLGNRTLSFALLVQSLLYCNAFGTVFLLSIYVQAVLGNGADVAGQVMAVGTLLMAAIAPFAGGLADRVKPGVIATFGIAVALAAGVWAAFLGAGSSLIEVALVLALQGVGFAFFSSPNMTMAMNSVPRERSGIAAALTAAARSLGMVLGMLIVGALVSVNLGHEPVGADPARFTATMQAAFWFLAAVTGLALVVSAWRATQD